MEKGIHIDHFIKRDLDPKKTFDWNNMVAAVHDDRFGADFKDSTVKPNDYDKPNGCYKEILHPVNDDLSHRFVFSTDGSIQPSQPYDKKAATTIRIFNLQEESLKQRRKSAMQAVRDMAPYMSKETIAEYLKDEPFPSAIAYELEQITESPIQD